MKSRANPLRRTQTRLLLAWSQYSFLIIGILALGYFTITLLDTRLYQADQARRFKQANSSVPAIVSENLPSVLPPAPPARAEELSTTHRESFPLGRIEIQRIGIAAMIMEGTDERTLRRAVGHFAGTSLPGQAGNMAIAGHRDTFFRALRHIRKDDEITVETATGSYLYRADYTEVVDPEDTEVPNSSDDALLTLVTCYPFTYVGPAPKRFVVRAHRVR